MSTDVDAQPDQPAQPPPPAGRGTGRYVLLAVGLVVVLGAVFALWRTGVLGGTDEASGDADGYHDQLAATVVNVLEQMPAEGHGHHGDAIEDVSSTLVCGVNIYGTSPTDADTVDEVTQVYGYHMCAMPAKGLDFLLSPKLTGPLVVTLAADPPTVKVVNGGEGFPDRVRQVIPEPYQEQALRGSLTEEGMRELRRRYDEAAG